MNSKSIRVRTASRPASKLRPANLRDLKILVAHRRGMWKEMGVRNKKSLEAADPVYRRWAAKYLKSGDMAGWIIEISGVPVASGCVWLQPVQPRPGFKGGGQPYLLSMFTEPKWRGQGFARQITIQALRWAKSKRFPRMTLHASPSGRRVYERLGFKDGNEMTMELDKRKF